MLRSWLGDGEVQRFLQVNRYHGLLWFNKESFEQWLWWMFLLAAIAFTADQSLTADEAEQRVVACYDLVQRLRIAAAEAGYRVDKLLEVVS